MNGRVAAAWTPRRIRSLGATTDIVTAGEIFGMSRNTAYTLANCGEFPVPVLRFGRLYRVSVAAILHVLDIPLEAPDAVGPGGLDLSASARVDRDHTESAGVTSATQGDTLV